MQETEMEGGVSTASFEVLYWWAEAGSGVLFGLLHHDV